MKVSIVIPNFNGAALLKHNLPFVHHALEFYEQKTREKTEIIITDDASTDESKEVVKSLSFPVHFFEHQKNAGFATNVNRGVEKAKGEIVVLLNTDVRPEKEFLLSLVDHFSNDTVFAVGCMDKSLENGGEVLRGRGVGKWTKGFLVHGPGDISGTDSLWASGGSSAFRRSLWEKLGGMNEVYNPFYWEDIDLSYRALKSGYKVLFERKSIVVHAHDEGAIRTKFSKQEITTTAYRNQFLFVWLNITDFGLFISHIVWTPINVLTGVLHRDFSIGWGFFRAILHLTQVFARRTRNRREFRVSDHQVLKEHSE